MSEMQVMDPTGHTTVRWCADNKEDVDAAREVFDAMRAKGYSAFTKGKAGKRIDTFDPKAESLILIPQLVGG